MGRKIGFKHSKETLKKLRDAKLKNPTLYWLGKKRPEMVGKKYALGSKHTEEWKKANSERMKGNKHAYIDGSTNTPEKRKEIGRRHQLKKYGITLDGYNEILIKQNHKCAICEVDESVLRIKLAVDHNHITNKVRGLLCDKCNRGIGMLNEDTGILSKAITYLLTN